MTPAQRKRLSYIVPGYVWQQRPFEVAMSDEVKTLMTSRRGVIYVDSQSVSMREYAATFLLSVLQHLDYHVDIAWTSFFPKEANEFTGAIRLPKPSTVRVIAVKVDATPTVADQVEDLCSISQLAIVAADRLVLSCKHSVLHVSASSAGTVRI